MTYTDFIAVIDLGTSHIVGMVGRKNENDVLSIMAYDVEKSEGCIRRGCVYNVEETAKKIRSILRKLENKAGGIQIGKIYVGVGSKSIRTIDHTVSKVLGAEGEVTSSVLRQLDEECRSYHPAMLDVLEIIPPVYLLDGKEENDPLGISCSLIEARYKLIVGQPTIRRSILTNIADRLKLQIAGILVSPLALTDLVLTPADKQGAALIDFGAGVTSVTIYKNGRLKAVTVVPLGAHLITRDIMTLKVSEMEAERLKRMYGSALPLDRDKEQEKIEINKMDDFRMQEMPLSNLNEIVEARSREIVENAYARLEDAGVAKDTGFKIFIAGAAGSGNDRKVMGIPVAAPPGAVCSQSYLYAAFTSEEEASNFEKYIRTRFFRILVSALKVTQSAPARTYRYVPLQDFGRTSDIDWSRPTEEIDTQLYCKYGIGDMAGFIRNTIDEL